MRKTKWNYCLKLELHFTLTKEWKLNSLQSHKRGNWVYRLTKNCKGHLFQNSIEGTAGLVRERQDDCLSVGGEIHAFRAYIGLCHSILWKVKSVLRPLFVFMSFSNCPVELRILTREMLLTIVMIHMGKTKPCVKRFYVYVCVHRGPANPNIYYLCWHSN